MTKRVAYLPLLSYPESPSDEAIASVVAFVASEAWQLHVSTFAISIPQPHSPLGGLVIDVPGLVRATEEKSKAKCVAMEGTIKAAAGPSLQYSCTMRQTILGGALDAAAEEARYYDLALVPWIKGEASLRDLVESVAFGSGRPTLLLPVSAKPPKLDKLAIAWDGSRVAARALNDALVLLPKNGSVTVLTVNDEKPLKGTDIAEVLAKVLEQRGIRATARNVSLQGRPIENVLQEEALNADAKLLAMGGFGHSRLRDFVLGGATRGVMSNLHLPVLLSH